MMRLSLLFCCFLLCTPAWAANWVGMGTTSPLAALDVTTTTSGILMPRLTTAQRTAIALPPIGLFVYDTSLNSLYMYTASGWASVGGPWSVTGSNVWYTAGMVGIGTTTPQAALDVSSTTSGLLPPRMTTTQRTAISSPTAGSVVYDTTANALYVYNGSTWVAASGGGGGVYAASCAIYTDTVCVQMDTTTGASSCRINTDQNLNAAWGTCVAPFSASSTATYTVTCTRQSIYTTCIRMNTTTGTSSCSHNNSQYVNTAWNTCTAPW
jgi:hypothetical protein